MVDTVTRLQSAGGSPAVTQHTVRPSRASAYMQALTDAIVLSAQARQVMNELSKGQTVAEAWLSQITSPPDPSERAASQAGGLAERPDTDAQAVLQAAMNQAIGDLAWLFDAMSPPQVDLGAVAKVLAERIATDALGDNPPLPHVMVRAEQTNTVAALYVENLSVTATGGGKTTASVDRVALTTLDPSLARSTRGADRPLVVDVGGEAGKVTSDTLPPTPAERQREREQERIHALLLIRQGGQTQPGSTLHVKLDVLLPLG